MIRVSEYASRREKLHSLMEEGSLMVLFSGVAKTSTADEVFKFEVNHNFYYLTGIEEEGCALLLLNDNGQRKDFLLIPPSDPLKAKWYGKRLSMEEAGKISGIHNVLLVDSLNARVDGYLSGSYSDFGGIDKVYVDLTPELKIAEETSTKNYAACVKANHEGIEIIDAMPLFLEARMKKSPQEIEEVRAAVETTRLGIRAMMASVREGKREYELADTFIHTINDDNGFNGIAFNSIIASGAHACTLHYPLPYGVCGKDDLVLVDCGARHHYYCGDISRTFPVSGKFSPLQRTIYSIVLEANKLMAKTAKPGMTLMELNDLVKDYMAKECVKQHLLAKEEDIGEVYFHSVSHHIGLDTHDISDRKRPLEPNEIISDEPGLYFSEYGIGVRIEDDILITETGAEVLSSGIIKEIADIEAFFASAKR